MNTHPENIELVVGDRPLWGESVTAYCRRCGSIVMTPVGESRTESTRLALSLLASFECGGSARIVLEATALVEVLAPIFGAIESW